MRASAAGRQQWGGGKEAGWLAGFPRLDAAVWEYKGWVLEGGAGWGGLIGQLDQSHQTMLSSRSW